MSSKSYLMQQQIDRMEVFQAEQQRVIESLIGQIEMMGREIADVRIRCLESKSQTSEKIKMGIWRGESPTTEWGD